MEVVAYVLFFLAGLGFGYAAPGRMKWLPLLFPLALALGALVRDGLEGEVVVRLMAALALAAIGVVLGSLLDSRALRRGSAQADS
jgi:hypothetical protein